MAKNPFKDSTRKTRRSTDNAFLDLGVVKQVDADATHTVLVEILSTGGDSGPVVAAATVSQQGDISVPDVGSLVVIGRVKGRRPIVLGVLYTTEDDIPEYLVGERHIGGEAGTFISGPFVRAPSVSSDPDSPPDGAIWYREDLDEYRGVEGGSVVSFSTAAV